MVDASKGKILLMSVALAEEYRTTPCQEFCKRYGISTKTAIKVFGAKTSESVRNRQAAQQQNARDERESIVAQVVRETWLPAAKVKKLNRDFTLTEIRKGKWVWKEFVPHSIDAGLV